MILETLRNFSFDMKKVTADEYAGPCPFCGGDDRFRVWPGTGKFWCRQCKKRGDEIQLIRDYKGFSYIEACQYIGIQPKPRNQGVTGFKRKEWQPKPVKAMPCDLWQQKTRQLVDWSMEMLRLNKTARGWLSSERGLADATIKAASLGWNNKDVWKERSEFGLDPAISKNTGKPKKVWIPAGLIIPYIVDDKVIRVRIRRKDPGAGDRYILLPGSDTRPMILGNLKSTLSIIESELDGLLVNQDAGDQVGVVALGNAQARPDQGTDKLLRQADLILNSLDNDEAGAKEAWTFWKKNYHQVKRWTCVGGKDPGEMIKAGVGVRSWINAGIKKFKIEWIDPLKPEETLLKTSSMATDCPNCPACGTWDHAEFKGKQVCFYTAYYVGKAGKPVACDIAKLNCRINSRKE